MGGWVGRWCWVVSSAGASYYFGRVRACCVFSRYRTDGIYGLQVNRSTEVSAQCLWVDNNLSINQYVILPTRVFLLYASLLDYMRVQLYHLMQHSIISTSVDLSTFISSFLLGLGLILLSLGLGMCPASILYPYCTTPPTLGGHV